MAQQRNKRNIGLAIFLSLITCGIYYIYWFIVLTDEVNAVSKTENGTSGGVAFLFSLLTCGIYSFYWAYKQGEKIDKAKTEKGIASSNSGVLYLVLSIFGLSIVAYALMQDALNKFE